MLTPSTWLTGPPSISFGIPVLATSTTALSTSSCRCRRPARLRADSLSVVSLHRDADIRRNMSTGRVTLPLAPGTSGTLHAFDTEWRITRPAAGVVLSAANSMQGVQQRLNVLGYHLRTPGAANPGIDSIYARITERAVLSFQVDYRLPAGAPAGSPAGPLRVRGEWTANPGIQVNLNKYNGGPTPNPSGADGTAVQQALVAFVGM